MQNQFIQENRGFLARMSRTVRVVSTVLVVLGTLWAAAKAVALLTRLGDWNALREEWANTPSGIALYLLLGIIGLALSGFLRYLCDPEYKPTWLLRHGGALMYAYAAILSLQGLADVGYILYHHGSAHPVYAWIAVVADLLFVAAAVLILAGLAQVYKRLLPMIDEARALV